MLPAMFIAAAPRRRGRVLAVVVVVLIIHAALGLWLLGARAWPERQPVAPQPPVMVVRLLVAEPGRGLATASPRTASRAPTAVSTPASTPVSSPAPSPSPTPSPTPAPTAAPTPPTPTPDNRVTRLPPSPDGLRAITSPLPRAGPQVGVLPVEAAAGGAGSLNSAPPPPPLQLALPHGVSAQGRPRNPALDDPRTNAPRRTLEAAIAGTLGGDDRLVEDRLGDGRIRYRRGTDCILVQPARGALIDPFNQSALNTPRLVGDC